MYIPAAGNKGRTKSPPSTERKALIIRLTPILYTRLRETAHKSGCSMNVWVEKVLEESLNKQDAQRWLDLEFRK